MYILLAQADQSWLELVINKIDPNHLFYCVFMFIFFMYAFPKIEPIIKLILEHNQKIQDKKFEREDRNSRALELNSESLRETTSIIKEYRENCSIHQARISNKVDRLVAAEDIDPTSEHVIDLKEEVTNPPEVS